MIYTAEISKRNDYIYTIRLRDRGGCYEVEITEPELIELAEIPKINATNLILFLKSSSYFTELTEVDFFKMLDLLKSKIFKA